MRWFTPFSPIRAGNSRIAEYLNIAYVPGVGELAVVCAALVGGGLAFLWHNAPPASVFMGDTGSLALGGIIGSIAFMTQQPLHAHHRRRVFS